MFPTEIHPPPAITPVVPAVPAIPAIPARDTVVPTRKEVAPTAITSPAQESDEHDEDWFNQTAAERPWMSLAERLRKFDPVAFGGEQEFSLGPPVGAEVL